MVVDIIILIFIVLGAITGYKKGLVGILVSLVGLILSIILAFFLQAPVADYLYNNTSIGTTLNSSISAGIVDSLNNQAKSQNNTNISIQNSFYDNILKNVKNSSQVVEASKSITMFILKGISFIIVFIIVFIICYILSMILNLVFDLPILNSANKLGGIAAGALKALLKIWVLLAILSFISPLPIANNFISIIQNTTLTKFLYVNNIIVSIVGCNLKI